MLRHDYDGDNEGQASAVNDPSGSSAEVRFKAGSVSRLTLTCTCGRRIPVLIVMAGSDAPASATPLDQPRLRPFERDVLALVRAGMTDRQIAHEIGVPLGRVKHAVRVSLRQLGAHNRAEAAVIASAAQLLPPP